MSSEEFTEEELANATDAILSGYDRGSSYYASDGDEERLDIVKEEARFIRLQQNRTNELNKLKEAVSMSEEKVREKVDPRIIKIKERLEAASSGDWPITYENDTGPNDEGFWEWLEVGPFKIDLSRHDKKENEEQRKNAELVSNCRQDMLYLLSSLEKDEELNQLKEAVRWLDFNFGCESCASIRYFCEVMLLSENEEIRGYAKTLLGVIEELK